MAFDAFETLRLPLLLDYLCCSVYEILYIYKFLYARSLLFVVPNDLIRTHQHGVTSSAWAPGGNTHRFQLHLTHIVSLGDTGAKSAQGLTLEDVT